MLVTILLTKGFMDEFEIELKVEFLNESEDLLESAESAFLRLETERENADLLNEIFRLAHNLKGTSKAVGFNQLSELTHVAENLILKLKEGSLTASDSIVSTLLEFKDKVQEMVEELKNDLDATFDIETLKAKIEQEINGGVVATSENESTASEETTTETVVEAKATENVVSESSSISQAAIESLLESGMDPELVKQMLAEEDTEEKVETKQDPRMEFENIEKLPEVKKADDNKPVVENKPPAAPKKTVAKKSNEPDESIRVKLSRIDQINNVLGELVILQTVISQRRYEHIHDELANKSIGMMGKLFKEVQELSMSLRMLPLKPTFQKMTRIVRDTSKLLDKQVNLNLLGEETEVDKTVLEKLGDPLVHIVRNAVDHGLETADIRQVAGKDPVGNVELYAFHEGSNLVIQVTDDGKGIDPEVIKKKAIENGILNANTNISDQEAIQLIFHPGLSTKEQVTEVSGRGVGMDVVKTNIENLGGEIKLMSKKGQGSSIKIILPLTLAIIEGIVIRAENDKFVLPLSQIYEITQIQSDDIESFTGVASLFTLRGEVLPLFFINKKLGKKVDETSNYTVIVVREMSYTFGVVVDDILIQQQIVIKKLGEDIQGKKGILGSAIMADGMPSLILDMFELFKDDFKQSRGYQKFIDKSIKAA